MVGCCLFQKNRRRRNILRLFSYLTIKMRWSENTIYDDIIKGAANGTLYLFGYEFINRELFVFLAFFIDAFTVIDAVWFCLSF